MNEFDINIISRIPIGSDKRITSRDICIALKTSGAQVRKSVHKARSEGLPVGSDREGYFLAMNPNDLMHSIRHINSRIHELIEAREGLKKAMAMFVGYEEYQALEEVFNGADQQ